MTIFLETDRLFLRPLDRSQFNHIFALRSDPDVMRFGGVLTQHEVSRYIEMLIQYQSRHGIGVWSVFEKDKDDFIGQAGLFHLEYKGQMRQCYQISKGDYLRII